MTIAAKESNLAFWRERRYRTFETDEKNGAGLNYLGLHADLCFGGTSHRHRGAGVSAGVRAPQRCNDLATGY